ncbi:MAG TPA: SpoIIE family protein phosphatase [Acidobacteriota bacterium]|nr:SpoIIE family protein phosphatase [Acidobacteriota bacterium]
MPEQVILVVDDEVANLQKLRRTFINRYPVLAASSGGEALELVQKHDNIAVIVADQRMPDMTGIEFLRRTMDTLPEAVRIILTGFTDVDVLMEAINHCKVFRYMVKPWDPPDLLMTVERGLEAHRLAAENARFRKELIRRERLARELEIAREIQRYILPTQCPSLREFEMAVEYHPAREVGGDLYDFDWDADSAMLQILIGDVSGKSIPAALYGAVFSGQVRSLFARSMSPGEILSFLNINLMARYQVSNYIAVTYLRLNLDDGTGLVANGGMPYPYLVKGGAVTRVEVSGIPLGLMEGVSYDEVPIKIEKGDILILSSDGTTDAVNPDGQMYDVDRFMEAIRMHSLKEISCVVKSLYQEVSGFASHAEVSDDVTILALRRRR